MNAKNNIQIEEKRGNEEENEAEVKIRPPKAFLSFLN